MPFHDTVTPLAKSRTLSKVFLLACCVGVYSLLAVAKEFSPYHAWADIPSQIHAALSLVLGCLLVFRTNTAYNRWWEARTLWGGLVNACRNLAIKMHQFIDADEEHHELIRKLIIAFPVALKAHLRDERDQLPTEVIELAMHAKHVPLGIANRLYSITSVASKTDKLSPESLWVIEGELHRLMDLCGGCERIQKTRIVRSYRTFARQITALLLITLPWGMVADFLWWTVPLTVIIAYFMIGLEVVAENVEEPFGYDEDDLDLEGLCRTIEATVDEVFATVRPPVAIPL